jgi:hypothetical protein
MDVGRMLAQGQCGFCAPVTSRPFFTRVFGSGGLGFRFRIRQLTPHPDEEGFNAADIRRSALRRYGGQGGG